ncbi:MAG: tetratricopeptide repeat protein, partial [Pseudomonadota bacterium]
MVNRAGAWTLGLMSLGTLVLAGLMENREQEGEAAFAQGHFEEAIKRFEDPYRRGVAQYRAGHYQESAKSFDEPQRNEVRLDALYNLGNSRFHLGDFPGAIEAYETLLKERTSDADAQYNLSVARAVLTRLEGEKDADKVDKKQDKKEDQKQQDKKQDQKEDKKDGQKKDQKEDKKDGQKKDQ